MQKGTAQYSYSTRWESHHICMLRLCSRRSIANTPVWSAALGVCIWVINCNATPGALESTQLIISRLTHQQFAGIKGLHPGHLVSEVHTLTALYWSKAPAIESNRLTPSLPAAGGVHTVQAAEATTLKALMQLYAPSTVKQRAGRDKRVVRTMLQDSRETLLQSIAVTAQTGLQNVTAHLAALHCVMAVQNSVPVPAAALSAADAPPGFAPKPSPEPSAPSPFALKLWPFGNNARRQAHPRQWPAKDPGPLLQLLRVHKVLASKSKQQVPQQLLAGILQSASAAAAHSPSLAKRLLQEVREANRNQTSLTARTHLLELQQLHRRGGSHSSSAIEQLCDHVATTLPNGLTGGSLQQGPAQSAVEAILQLANWSETSNGTAIGRQAEVLGRLRDVAVCDSEVSGSYMPSDASDQALCLAAAVRLAPSSAAAWLAYADYLHSLCNPQRSTTLLQSPTPASSQGSAEAAGESQPDSDKSDVQNSSDQETLVQMIKAYCTYLKLAAQSVGQAGLPDDHMPVLLKLLQLLNLDELVPEGLHALMAGVEAVPALTWRCVVPQLFALLAHQDAGVWQLAQELLQALEMLDPAAVLYPALVESRHSNTGKGLNTLTWRCCMLHRQ